jgi:hypothetical protein
MTIPALSKPVNSGTDRGGGMIVDRYHLLKTVAIHNDGRRQARSFISLMGSSFHMLKRLGDGRQIPPGRSLPGFAVMRQAAPRNGGGVRSS